MTYSGPVYRSYEVKSSAIVLTFDHIAAGLSTAKMNTTGEPGVLNNTELKGFSIAGEDKKFVWAKAKIIDDGKVKVWNSKIKNPVAVRYSWGNQPER